MLTLLGIWVPLSALCLIVGHAILSLLPKREVERTADWLVLAFWIGLILNVWIAWVLSFFVSLRPVTFFPIAALIGLACLYYAGSDLALRLRALLRIEAVAATAIIACAAAFIAAGLRSTPDTGEYHYPLVRWLAEYGSVTGIAHLYHRFGYISGVFALLAPFDSIVPGRGIAAVNGFIFALVGAQAVVASMRIGRTSSRPSDWFLLAASIGVLGLGLVVGSVTTATPDLSIMALTVVAGWRMLADGEQPTRTNSLIPLILSCGALDAKLSGLLFVPIAGLYRVWGRKLNDWIVAAGVAGLLVLPYFVASIIASGCLALPVLATCTAVPWALPHETVQELSGQLYVWTRWGGPTPPPGAGMWDWLPDMLLARDVHWLDAIVFWPFAISLCGYLALTRGRITRSEAWVLAFILPSIAMVFIRVPDLRYNFGLFITPVALLIMRIGMALPLSLGAMARRALGPVAVAALLAVLEVSFALSIDLRKADPSRLSIVERLWTTRPAPKVDVASQTAGGFKYSMPRQGAACWGAPLPCTNLLLTDVTLQHPDHGLSGGFIRVR